MQPQAQRMSAVDFLAREENSRIKHEYVDGEIYAMSGASRRHQLLLGNLYFHARRSASGLCQVFTSGMMVRIEARNSFYYPDVLACCDSEDRGERYLTSPCFVVEVLSPSTASVDRREKRLAYSTLESLCEYVIVDQDRMHVVVYRGGPWAAQVLSEPEHILELTCVRLRIPLSEVYAGVHLPPPCVRDPSTEPDWEWAENASEAASC
jgi:Uma2 family endonuclease